MEKDENGNWIADPIWDQDVEEIKEKVEKEDAVRAHLMAEKVSKATNQFYLDSWQEGLKEVGLSQKEYNELVAIDPEGTTKLVKDAIKGVAKAAASKKGKSAPERNAQGQFTPQGQAQPQPGRDTRDIQKAEVLLDSKRKKARSSGLSYEDELDIISSIGRLI